MNYVAQVTKQELSTERLELSIIQDVKALQKRMAKINDELKSFAKVLKSYEAPLKQFRELEKVKQEAVKRSEESGDIMEKYGRAKDEYNRVFDNAEQAAKTLGIKVSEIPEMKELDKTFDDLADTYRPYQQLNDLIGDLSGRFRP